MVAAVDAAFNDGPGKRPMSKPSTALNERLAARAW